MSQARAAEPTGAGHRPPRGLVGVGIGGLALEALVLLLAAPAVASLQRGHVSGWEVGALLGLAVLVVVAAGWLRRPGGRIAGSVVQPLVIATGAIAWPMYVVGGLFTLVWIYYLRLWPR